MNRNSGLLNKKRFEWLERERIRYLKHSSIEENIKMMEALASFSNELHKNFLPDYPCNIRIGLRKKNRENRRSIRKGS